jgi:hypothetical protein
MWSCVEIKSPKWQDVSAAIRRMDDNEYPIVQLSWKDIDSCFDDEASFNVIGGPVSGFALFEVMPGWISKTRFVAMMTFASGKAIRDISANGRISSSR